MLRIADGQQDAARRAQRRPAPGGAPQPDQLRRPGQCWTLTGITFPDNQTRSWLTSQNNQKVVLTGIQYHFGPEPETGPDRPSRALEASDRHLYTPKQPFNFKYISFLAVSDLLRLSRDVSRPYSYFSRVLDQSDAGGHG